MLTLGDKSINTDNTLGALFLGLNISAIFYGITCLQTFIYFTSTRRRTDRYFIPLFVWSLFFFDTANQALNTVGVYKLIIGGFDNVEVLITSIGHQSAGYFLIMNIITVIISRTLVQLFYAHRVWAVSFGIRKSWRMLLAIVITLLTFAQIGSSVVILIASLHNNFFVSNNIKEGLRPVAYYTDAATGIACDIIITISMSLLLHYARSDSLHTNMNSVLNALILFTIQTGLVTTILLIGYLAMYIFFPNTLIGAAIAFILSKSYPNSALALLNSRDFLRTKVEGKVNVSYNDGSKTTNEVTFATRRSESRQTHRSDTPLQYSHTFPHPYSHTRLPPILPPVKHCSSDFLDFEDIV